MAWRGYAGKRWLTIHSVVRCSSFATAAVKRSRFWYTMARDFGCVINGCRRVGFVIGRGVGVAEYAIFKPMSCRYCCGVGILRRRVRHSRGGRCPLGAEEGRVLPLAFHCRSGYSGRHGSEGDLPGSGDHRPGHRIHPGVDCRAPRTKSAGAVEDAVRALGLAASQWCTSGYGVPRPDVGTGSCRAHWTAAGTVPAAEQCGGAPATGGDTGSGPTVTQTAWGSLSPPSVPTSAGNGWWRVVQRPDAEPSLSRVHPAGGGAPEVPGLYRRRSGGLFCLVLGTAPSGTPGPFHRLVGTSAAVQHPLYCL